MRALVLTEEDAVAYGQYLTPLPTAELNDLTYTRYTQDCADRRASACTAFEMTSAGFHAEATLDRANLMFFSVPYDDGFTAYVDGQETEILRVDEGLMAVLCPAGTVTIDFVYQPDGIRLSRTVTLAALPVFLLYAGYFAWDERKNGSIKKPPLQEATAQRKAQLKEGILWAPGITRSSALTAIMSTCAAPTLKATS